LQLRMLYVWTCFRIGDSGPRSRIVKQIQSRPIVRFRRILGRVGVSREKFPKIGSFETGLNLPPPGACRHARTALWMRRVVHPEASREHAEAACLSGDVNLRNFPSLPPSRSNEKELLAFGMLSVNTLALCFVVQLGLAFGLAALFWPDKFMPLFEILMFPWAASCRAIRANGVASIGLSLLLLISRFAGYR